VHIIKNNKKIVNERGNSSSKNVKPTLIRRDSSDHPLSLSVEVAHEPNLVVSSISSANGARNSLNAVAGGACVGKIETNVTTAVCSEEVSVKPEVGSNLRMGSSHNEHSASMIEHRIVENVFKHGQGI
jgi:hypothetical protein